MTYIFANNSMMMPMHMVMAMCDVCILKSQTLSIGHLNVVFYR